MTDQRLGIVGLGTMGGAMARRLLGAGRPVTGFDVVRERMDRLAEAGLRPAADPAAVAREASVVLTSVMEGRQLETVVEGLVSAARSGLLVIDTSTVDPAVSTAVAARLSAAGGGLLRCPVSGSAALAAAGALVMMCSGDADDYERARPALDLLTDAHEYVGEGELARHLKLLVNLVVIGSMGLVGEAVALGEVLGLHAARVMEAINRSVIGSTFSRYKSEALSAGDFTPTATVSLVRKDLGLVLELAHASGLPMAMTRAADGQYAVSEQRGEADRDFSIVVEVARDRRATVDAEP